jgi:hypothetical protein
LKKQNRKLVFFEETKSKIYWLHWSIGAIAGRSFFLKILAGALPLQVVLTVLASSAH